MRYYIGIDNGVTGSVCVLNENGICLDYFATPVEKTLNYTKKKEYINRVKGKILGKALQKYTDATVVIERPLVNPARWKATVSAIRCDEATRIVLEILGLKFIYVDSKQWQSEMLPKRKTLPKDASTAVKQAYKSETKDLSLKVARQLFPNVVFKKDGDAALMAEWARKNKL